MSVRPEYLLVDEELDVGGFHSIRCGNLFIEIYHLGEGEVAIKTYDARLDPHDTGEIEDIVLQYPD